MTNQFALFLAALKSQLTADSITTSEAECLAYAQDNSAYRGKPEAVIFANSTQDVVKLLTLCSQYQIPVTARGRGTSTTGASVAMQGGVILSLERMDKILKVEKENRLLIAEAGVLNQSVQDVAKKIGLFWPPDPSSAAYSTVGGNLACNAAGPRAVKYGSCRENTLGLTVVLANGEMIQTGSKTTKNAVGYDLTRLMIGSEGTLGIITEAILKLTPLPENIITFQLFYENLTAAADAVSAIMAQPFTPCALEFMDEKAIQMIQGYADLKLPNAKAMLIVEVDGSLSSAQDIQQAILKTAHIPGLINAITAENPTQAAQIWKMRKALSPALKNVAPKKINEDVVVPVANIPLLIEGIAKLGKQYQTNIVNFGHAGNGNIHVNLMLDPADQQALMRGQDCLKAVFDLVLSLEGTLSGEHGIGFDKKPFMEKALGDPTIKMMKQIKNTFDPQGILNPGKLFIGDAY